MFSTAKSIKPMIVGVSLMLFGLNSVQPAKAATGPDQDGTALVSNEALDSYDAQGGVGRRVLEIPIEGTIELGIAAFVERALADVQSEDVVILRIKTFGGRVDAAVRIRDAILSTAAPTVAFVDQRAISAGALISLAADDIIMAEGASIGAATPVTGGGNGQAMEAAGEKVVSYMRAEMRSTAESRGRPGEIAEAMVDPDVAIDGVIDKGKTLTLTTDRALKLGIADDSVPSYAALFTLLNLEEAERTAYRESWAEKVARFLTEPTVSSLLMSAGFLGLLFELYSPGFGVGGVIGAVCITLFFAGQYVANLAGWEEAMMISAGLGLLALEVFVIPGFGLAGIAGLALLLAGLFFAMIELNVPLDVAFELDYFRDAMEGALLQIAVAIVILVGGTIAFFRYFSRSAVGRRIILGEATSNEQGYSAGATAEQHALVGCQGVARTTLRPAGIAEIAGKRIDVVTAGDYIDEGSAIEVKKVDFNRVIVVETKSI